MKLEGNELKKDDKGEIIQLLHSELTELGYTIPEHELGQSWFGAETRQAVYAFQRKHGLEATGAVDEATATRINQEVDKLHPEPEKTHVVRGTVVDHHRRGVGGFRVVAVDKNVGPDVRLGSSMSGERGAYEIRYSVARLNKERPDVQVQATLEDGKVLAVSAVRYNASAVESGLNVLIPEEKLSRPAEYRRLIDELGAQLGNPEEPELKKQLGKLREDDQRQDITYLANKTGWDARMVAMTALASQFGERSGIEPEFYYALFRAGVPANEAALSRLAPETVRQVWERAVEQRLLPAQLKDKMQASLDRFREYNTDYLLQAPAQIGVSSFQELLAGTLGDSDKQKRFAQLYYAKKGDLKTFWETLGTEFPEESKRLELDGKLGFLTINNAPLIQRLHEQNGDLGTPLDLVRQGLYRQAAWKQLLADDVPIPNEIPGENKEEKKANYASLMASQLCLSYPTAVVAEMVHDGTMPLHTEKPVEEAVTNFLDAHQGKFELGIHPVEYYLSKNNIALEGAALAEVKKLQRVYQISPSDEVMGKLLQHNLDSAYAVVRYDEQSFVDSFKEELGGEAMASLTYAKAHQIHHAVLNITTAYLLAESAPGIYALEGLPALSGIPPDGNSGVLAYPTLKEVFGEMDYCTCEHCRSWLSPAAYLVDLLMFLDPATYEKDNPLDVLLGRRPDVQHLQLTCENTNTVLPYIDLVNEVLEHYVVKGSLDEFKGHNIEVGVSTEELLASPQFVEDQAYTVLQAQVFPLPLPFHQRLEALGRYFDHFDVPLYEAMERLRKNDTLDRTGNIEDPAYGWQDVLMERLQISRQEFAILTDSSTALQELYGYPGGTSPYQLINRLSNAKTFARRLDLTYEELIEIVRTQFINPHSHLLPKLERLTAREPGQQCLDFKAIQDFAGGKLTEAEFKALLPEDLDQAAYGGDVKQWVRDNEAKIMGLIVFSDPSGSEDICSFDTVELRYAKPDLAKNKLRPIEFLKLLRFIRLWRKLGWTIEQTDKALAALYPADQRPTPAEHARRAKSKLDAGFKTFVPRLAHLQTVMEQLQLKPKRDLTALLACWSTIDTHGYNSLYRQMFLNPTILALDPVFGEDGYGEYLAAKKEYQAAGAVLPKLLDHVEALRAAFNLTQEELELIQQELGFDKNTLLDLANISAVFRYGYLARKLRFSVQEFLTLRHMSGLDPFELLDMKQLPNSAQSLGSVRPPAIRFIELAQRIKGSPFKVSQLAYYLQHEDWSGSASPPSESVLALVRTLRNDLLRINNEHVVQEDPDGEIARAKMALVYGDETTNVFFGLLNSTTEFSVGYSHGESSLEPDILAVTDRIVYDDFEKRLSYCGVMTAAEKAALEGAGSATADFETAVQALFDRGQEMFEAFFATYPDLKELYEGFADGNEPLEDKMSALLADFLPELRARLKQQQLRQTVSAQLGADLTLMTPLLEDATLLHAVDTPADPAIVDFLALEVQGLSADIFFAEDVVGDANQAGILVDTIDYRDGGAALPPNPAGGNTTVSGVWRGFLEAPDNGFYNFYIEADAGAEISLTLDGVVVTIVENNGVWQNQDPVELEVGRLYNLTLTAKKVSKVLVLKWERKGMGRAPVPPAQLYPTASLERFTNSYLRLLKALAITDALTLSSAELEHFAGHADYLVDGEGWLNALPVAPSPAEATIQALLRNAMALLQYCTLRDAFKAQDERLLQLLQYPEAIGEDGQPLLNRVTNWQEADRISLQSHFGLTTKELAHLEHFGRLYDAFAVIKKLGIGAATLLDITTNEPGADRLRNLQGALRARYDDSPGIDTSLPTGDAMPAKGAWPTSREWLRLIQPINDELRSLQRDALVAHVLYRLGQDDDTNHIDTPEKLFEYFLIDVQMDSCMKTSRIKQAISSVQLFIQRCLLNLEPDVASSAIIAKEWEWMKRYRVWEANRKVFLWPENWLEPELRDNKSPFFRDLESELLQSDITDDAAATALVHYLEKLDEVAKLEICGMYYEENEAGNKADDVLHVVARTAGARRTYYYRRQDGGIVWMPWEKIDLNIEDNPVLPVVWKGRLFLFWVSVLQEPIEPTSTNNEKMDLTDVKPSQLRGVAGEAKTRASVTLYWSEYYHGKWQPARTADLNKPIVLDDDFSPSGVGSFERAELELWSREEIENGGLIVSVGYRGHGHGEYTLFNTHSLPVVYEGRVSTLLVLQKAYGSGAYRMPCSCDDTLHASYKNLEFYEWKKPEPISHTILGRAEHDEIIQPCHPVTGIFEAPFFFRDPLHVFLVSSQKSEVLVAGHRDFGISTPAKVVIVEIPVLMKPNVLWDPEEVFFPSDLISPGVVDPYEVESFLREDPYIQQAVASTGTIQFGDRRVGPGGSMVLGNSFR